MLRHLSRLFFLDSIVFPDDYVPNIFEPKVPKKCRETFKTFCEDKDNYPERQIDAIIASRIAEFKDLLGSDELTVVNITQRIDSNDEQPICSSTEQLIKPTSAQNKDGEWFTIVNSEKYEQAIRVERCT